ncbi:uncharacterized protein LOC123536240 [Mercenaria mercenaria]|uniref:uncharacterized protein LOC123536240 n=1 Tax=Mercenaria mercenaria TaxID=6596 RepID=UPI00234E7287|nr:uncharacterized protein LOC123536240 [Mercenaria mercenaria]
MDKASRAIRRSGVKLLSLSSGHGDLNVLVSDIKDIKNCAKAFMNAQNLASQDMSRWASHEENKAVQIYLVIYHFDGIHESHLKEYRQMFEMILEGEKHVTQAKDNLDYCQEKEMKVRKEMRKVAKRASAIELRILQSRVEMAEKAREGAQSEVSERVRENEAVKLIRLKEGLLKMSSAYMELASQCNTIFMAERDIALQLPDVHGREIETIKYSGAGTTRFIVEKAKEKVQSYASSDVSSDPPPPYTPPESSNRASNHRSSAESSRIPHSSSDQRLVQSQIYDTPNVRPNPAQHRHSVPYDTRPLPGNRRSSDYHLRSRSDNNMCQMNQYTECSGMPTVRSSQSLPGEGIAYPSQGIIRENSGNTLSSQGSAQGIAYSSPGISSTERRSDQEGVSMNAINQSPAETFIHTNIVQIQQVVDLPPLEANCTKARETLGAEYNTDSTNPKRWATEHSSSGADFEDNFQFADEDDQLSDVGTNVRPVPAPRRCSSGEGYATAEEENEGACKDKN